MIIDPGLFSLAFLDDLVDLLSLEEGQLLLVLAEQFIDVHLVLVFQVRACVRLVRARQQQLVDVQRVAQQLVLFAVEAEKSRRASSPSGLPRSSPVGGQSYSACGLSIHPLTGSGQSYSVCGLSIHYQLLNII